MAFEERYKNAHQARFDRTVSFVKKHIASPAKLLDLGVPNPLSEMMESEGFAVSNTESGVDLDIEYDVVLDDSFDALCAFEIFEHMVAPFNLLKETKAKKLFASVPLNLWFSSSFWNDDDPLKCHYHEFESRQFDYLLKKAGWDIMASEKWTSPTNKIGIRPLLRLFTPRHYIVYCERSS